MLSLERKFLYIHLPKTAGNSVQNILKRYSDDDIVTLHEYQDGIERFEVRNKNYRITKHSTITEYKSVLDAEVYASLFKFSTIRNPWDRLISFYFSTHRGGLEWNRDNFKQLISEVPTARHYLCLDPGQTNAGSLASDLDSLLQFERLEEEFKRVASKLGVRYGSLKKRNSSSHDHYSTYYDDELIAMVESRFAEEIEFGNYKFETGKRSLWY